MTTQVQKNRTALYTASTMSIQADSFYFLKVIDASRVGNAG